MSHNLDSKISLNPEDYDSFRRLGFFNSSDNFYYTFKKTEKIVQAIYLVTQHIKDIEPLKNKLKESSLVIFDISLNLNSPENLDKNLLISSFFSSSLELLVFMNLASVSGLISKNNSSLISTEINTLVDYLKDTIELDLSKKGLILSKDFFITGSAESLKIENKLFPKKPINKAINDDNSIKDKKDNRQKEILDLLKKQPDLTIKDFTKVINNCSSKTIQRELILLVQKGLIKKEGERRWSRYSLK